MREVSARVPERHPSTARFLANIFDGNRSGYPTRLWRKGMHPLHTCSFLRDRILVHAKPRGEEGCVFQAELAWRGNTRLLGTANTNRSRCEWTVKGDYRSQEVTGKSEEYMDHGVTNDRKESIVQRRVRVEAA